MFIGLKTSKDLLKKRISKRVLDRIKKGVEIEIARLRRKGLNWCDQSMQSLGIVFWREYFEGKINKDELINKWIISELQYAKRQMTWFKKDKRILWFDEEDPKYKLNMENSINKWYKSSVGSL